MVTFVKRICSLFACFSCFSLDQQQTDDNATTTTTTNSSNDSSVMSTSSSASSYSTSNGFTTRSDEKNSRTNLLKMTTMTITKPKTIALTRTTKTTTTTTTLLEEEKEEELSMSHKKKPSSSFSSSSTMPPFYIGCEQQRYTLCSKCNFYHAVHSNCPGQLSKKSNSVRKLKTKKSRHQHISPPNKNTKCTFAYETNQDYLLEETDNNETTGRIHTKTPEPATLIPLIDTPHYCYHTNG
jgi:hypothetical protein